MNSRLSAGTALSPLGAILLTLVLAGQALAVTWYPPVAVTGWHTSFGAEMVTLGRWTAVVVYDHEDGLFVKRSTDSGATWSRRSRLSSTGDGPAIAGRGANVDAIWGAPGPEPGDLRIRYARSTDRGASFGSSVVIAAFPASVWDPEVWWIRSWEIARGPNGLVAVMWEEVKSWYDDYDDYTETTTRIRVSTDGGASFAPARTVATAPTDGGAAIAIGQGVIYVAYLSDWSVLRVIRSLDAGVSWSPPKTITSNLGFLTGFGQGAMTAEGSAAYVAYERDGSLRYRRTTNRGSSWSNSLILESRTKTDAWWPVMSIKGSMLRAVYARTPSSGWIDGQQEYYYRESGNGTTWTPAVKVAQGGHPPSAVGYAGKILVLHEEMREVGFDIEFRTVVHRGAP